MLTEGASIPTHLFLRLVRTDRGIEVVAIMAEVMAVSVVSVTVALIVAPMPRSIVTVFAVGVTPIVIVATVAVARIASIVPTTRRPHRLRNREQEQENKHQNPKQASHG